jgi:hypothetical protein
VEWELYDGVLRTFSFSKRASAGEDPPVEAYARATLYSGDPEADEDGELWTCMTTLRVVLEGGRRTIDPIEPPDLLLRESYFARGVARARIKSGVISGARLTEPTPTGKKEKVKIKPNMKSIRLVVTSKGVMRDPVELSIVEYESDLTVATEQLFCMDSDCSGIGEVVWDDTVGIVLDVPRDDSSSVVIAGAFESSWVTQSTGSFSVMLADGHFEATGELATVPWVFTYDDSVYVIKAELAPEYVPELVAEYQVPEEAVEPDVYYQQELAVGLPNVWISGCTDEGGPSAVRQETWGGLKKMFK